MSATEVVYLYSHGKRRHIASGAHDGTWSEPALCGNWYMPEEAKVEQLRRWTSEAAAERKIRRIRELPICAFCTKALEARS